MAAADQSLGLHNLPKPRGATKAPKRKGRGQGSGLGKTAGRGENGQNSRSGGGVRLGFEGGQMPLIRRVPKRGFWSRSKVENQVVNLRDLAKVQGDELTPVSLMESGLVWRSDRPIKILGIGDVTRALTVRGCAVSKSAVEKIQAAGGRVEA